MTPGVEAQVPPGELAHALRRHARGDWGEIPQEDWKSNELALAHGLRLVSAYRTKAGVKFWVITEADRSATTALLPSEY